jgi:hypothetical protein
VKLVCVKFTGIAPLIEPTTVNVVDASVVDGIVAANWMLLGVVLAVTPTIVRVVVVVMVIVAYPDAKMADPVPGPLVVDMVNVIAVVLLGGFTVAVIGTGFPSGTSGVLEKVTEGFTLTSPPGQKSWVQEFRVSYDPVRGARGQIKIIITAMFRPTYWVT